ncbi:hypothetical protein [Oricola indica]|jgi:hypothetical protein|uniref:hypothetical protein n=1 Tax=Oricola indica TaxID=2872591 RepID=UPI001CC0DC78|nr:hypothetical protein [Oricola indica]
MPAAKTKKSVALFATTALAFSAVGGVHFDKGGVDFVAKAEAKSSNAGGNGNGGGNSGSNGNSGGNSGKSSNAGGNGKSASASGKTKGNAASSNGNGSGNGKGLGNLFSNIFGKNKVDTSKTAAIPSNSGKKAVAATKKKAVVAKAKKPQTRKITNLAELPVPTARPILAKEKNFNAKLAGLNSLKRNYHAYLNAADPRMAGIRTYVLAYVDYENAVDDLALAEQRLTAAETALATLLTDTFSSITPYETTAGTAFTYDGISLDGLATRRGELQTVLDGLSDPASQEALDLQAEIAAIDSLIGSADATIAASAEVVELEAALGDVTTLNTQIAGLEGQITDEELIAALRAAANDNRVAEYGEDAYVDEELLAWAKTLLGVDVIGEDGTVEEDVIGKIDEIRDYLAAQAQALDPATDDPIIVPDES